MTRDDEIFAEALGRPAPARAALLELLCAGDAAQRGRIEALLAAHEKDPGFMHGSPARGLGPAGADPVAPPEEKPGDNIGRYRLLQKIGEGGFGIVFMAEQEQPLRRRVALKVIKLGMDTREVVARFEAERQALALMEHPNIARVFDGGATDSGRPYFVMELVKGVPITTYCDHKKLSTRARVELFAQVCHAIQHAHQKGIIHRDLKPSNILVTEQDDRPVPKVIDFGVARATQARLTEKTLFTQFHQLIGTPAYMSPEQAGMGSLDVDTRSDIYSLGALLYVLLTGRTPFDVKPLVEKGYDAMLRTIREVEPPKPSTRLRTLSVEELSQLGTTRPEDPRGLRRIFQGDLDWIVMKAMEKDRTRRYETANGLALDLQRHLRNEPIIARPPSTAYLFQKLLRRHRLAFVAGAAVAASLVSGFGFSTWEYLNEREARKRAVIAEQAQSRLREQAETARNNESHLRVQAVSGEQKAQTEAARRTQVAGFLKESFKDIGILAAVEGDTRLLSRILAQAVGRLEQELPDQPEVRADLLETLGGICFNIGEFTQAETVFTEALALRRQGAEPVALAQSLNYIGLVFSGENKLTDAEQRLREALEINLRVLGPGHPEVARTRSNLGGVLGQQGRLMEAKQLLNTALDQQRLAPGGGGTDAAQSLKRLGLVLVQEGRLPEAEADLREALRLNVSVLGHDHLEVASSLNFLAVTLAIQDMEPDGTGKIAEGITLYREALEIREKLKKSGGMQSRDTLTTVLTQQGTLAEVEAASREAHRFARTLFPNDRWKDAYYYALSTFVLLEEQKFVEAEETALRCLKIRAELNADDWSTFHARSMLGAALAGQGKFAEAEPLLLQGYEGMKQRAQTIPAAHRIWLGECLQRLVKFYAATNRPEEAARWHRELEELIKAAAARKAIMGRP